MNTRSLSITRVARTRYIPSHLPRRYTWGVAVILSLGAVLPVRAQTIQGTVVDQKTDEPIQFASVALVTKEGSVTKMAITDSEGTYRLTAPEPGIYSLRVDVAGYNTLNGIQFRARVSQTLTFDLRVWGLTELAPVVVEAEREPFAPGPLEGFYERQKLGRGHFITREEMESQGSSQFTDLLRGTPMVKIVPLRNGGYTVRFKNVTRIGGNCPPLLWVDGVRWGSIDLDGGPDRQLFPSDLEGIEIYSPTQVPPQFASTESLCGVVAAWTKRG